MGKYSILFLEKNNLYNANVLLKKNNIFLESFFEETFPEETFKITPFGVYPNENKIFNEKMELLLRGKKTKNWCLLLPDSWQKSLFLEEETIPANSKEIKTFIEWHFKKSYNLKPEEIRFSYILKNKNGKNALLVSFALEKMVSSLEDIFKINKKHLGQIISSFWSLFFLIPKKGNWALLNIDKQVWSFGIFEGQELISFRQKIIPKENLSYLIEEVERTIKLTQKHIEYFYFNLNNSDLKEEEFLLPFNLLKPDVEDLKFLSEPPSWWNSLKNIFLGALYGLP
mgnify:CR=1 FL=1